MTTMEKPTMPIKQQHILILEMLSSISELPVLPQPYEADLQAAQDRLRKIDDYLGKEEARLAG